MSLTIDMARLGVPIQENGNDQRREGPTDERHRGSDPIQNTKYTQWLNVSGLWLQNELCNIEMQDPTQSTDEYITLSSYSNPEYSSG
ncbi:hypothetical protein T265_10906 [Opisthorchis viverrini]|uniref:Uncharacterized protein n=1 Tax=Opisthorchis viverrini TaxID=6198 RepID=A0A074ZBI7_OPIVI|nr:hypothetical protein T265_10906 [Opisthorchis viverrini]KER20585.1 hypothetical protein T265_10906 [Opisthorchis viverrini]